MTLIQGMSEFQAIRQISQELRRGNDYATITSLAFDYRSQWLGCASDQGTIHIFAVNQDGQQ